MNNFQEAAKKYADNDYDENESPIQWENAQIDFIEGARWAIEECAKIVHDWDTDKGGLDKELLNLLKNCARALNGSR